MLAVGIHEKVSLTVAAMKASKQDGKPYLSLTFSQVDPEAVQTPDASGVDDFNSNDVTSASASNSTEISLWGSSVAINGVAIEPERVRGKLLWQKDALSHILEGYMVKSAIKWDLFYGMNLPAEPLASKTTIARMMTSQTEIDKITANINAQFLTMLGSVPDTDRQTEFRIKLCRSSKAKNYPALPNSAYGFPFWENMIVPQAASKVKFTKSEIDYGSDKGDKVEPESNASHGSSLSDAYGTL